MLLPPTQKQQVALDWFRSLSINQMKALVKKYFPEFTLSLITLMGSDWIAEMHEGEGFPPKISPLEIPPMFLEFYP